MTVNAAARKFGIGESEMLTEAKVPLAEGPGQWNEWAGTYITGRR